MRRLHEYITVGYNSDYKLSVLNLTLSLQYILDVIYQYSLSVINRLDWGILKTKVEENIG